MYRADTTRHRESVLDAKNSLTGVIIASDFTKCAALPKKSLCLPSAAFVRVVFRMLIWLERRLACPALPSSIRAQGTFAPPGFPERQTWRTTPAPIGLYLGVPARRRRERRYRKRWPIGRTGALEGRRSRRARLSGTLGSRGGDWTFSPSREAFLETGPADHALRISICFNRMTCMALGPTLRVLLRDVGAADLVADGLFPFQIFGYF